MQHFRWIRLFLLSTVLFAVSAATVWAADTPDTRPNILFCIADDWGWPHAGAYGDPVVKTPTFDRIARQGVLFHQAYVAAPSCTPSRAGVLTGQAVHRLEESANLWSLLRGKFRCYPDLLEEAGYYVGLTRKGWGPGTLEGTGRSRNPAGPKFRNFAQFLKSAPKDRPFCFWFGSTDPHRPYEKDSGVASGMDSAKVVVPPWLPDTPAIRSDICDYYWEVQRFDREVGEILDLLAKDGKLKNTLVIMTGDHGMPFPRAKCNLYDSGTRVPFAVGWPAQVPGGREVTDFVSFCDIAPTFLEAAGVGSLEEMTGRSFLNVLRSKKSGRVDPSRDKVFSERERHTLCRSGNRSYPCRMIRTDDFLYIRNLRPDESPTGDVDYPNVVGDYGDIDGSPSKTEIITRRHEPKIAPFFRLACSKRPAEELFDLAKDPGQVRNVAGQPEYAEVQAKLRGQLEDWMQRTTDPRVQGETDFWDTCPYVGRRRPPAKKK